MGNDFDTFTYTISDGRGGESVGNVQVDVIDAVPSDISGVVYLDVNNNGIHDPQEIELAGVEVTLTGTNIRGVPLNITVKTDMNGVFMFENILPNAEEDTIGYSITSATEKFLIDGKDSIVDAAAGDDLNPGIAGNDVFTGIDLGLWGTHRSEENYLFGERGLQSKYISIAQYLSSTTKGLAAATNMQGEDFWFTVLQGWEGMQVRPRPIGQRYGQLPADDRGCQQPDPNQNDQLQALPSGRRPDDRRVHDLLQWLGGGPGIQSGRGWRRRWSRRRVRGDVRSRIMPEGADEVFANGQWA